MEKLTGAEKSYNGLTAEDLSDLSGIDADAIVFLLDNPRRLTLAEVEALAPHLGVTAEAFVHGVLA